MLILSIVLKNFLVEIRVPLWYIYRRNWGCGSMVHLYFFFVWMVWSEVIQNSKNFKNCRITCLGLRVISTCRAEAMFETLYYLKIVRYTWRGLGWRGLASEYRVTVYSPVTEQCCFTRFWIRKIIGYGIQCCGSGSKTIMKDQTSWYENAAKNTFSTY